MAHKTITISEEAYRALKRMKEKNESFTKVILRITRKKGTGVNLLKFLKELGPNDELADAIEDVYLKRQSITLREV